MKYFNAFWFAFLGYSFARLATDGWFPVDTKILEMTPGQAAAFVISQIMCCMAIFFFQAKN